MISVEEKIRTAREDIREAIADYNRHIDESIVIQDYAQEDWGCVETQDCFIPTQEEQEMLDELLESMDKDVLSTYIAYYGREIISELYNELKEEELWVKDV